MDARAHSHLSIVEYTPPFHPAFVSLLCAMDKMTQWPLWSCMALNCCSLGQMNLRPWERQVMKEARRLLCWGSWLYLCDQSDSSSALW